MIIGATVLLQATPAEDSYRILGYPVLPIILLAAAAGGGIALTYDIWRHDRRRR